MNKIKYIILILIFSALLAACSPDLPQISVESDSFEFGDVVNGTIISREIVIRNTGNSNLLIENISTSCGCTTAEISEKNILPGNTGILLIKFDSGAHGPELEGLLKREIFITSNDPVSPEIKIEFTANVTK